MVVPRSRDRSFYGSVFRSLFRFSSLLSLETCVGVSKTQADEFVMNRRRTSSREAPTFHPTAWRDRPKSLGRTRGATLGTAVKALFGPYRSPHNDRIHLRSLAQTPFRTVSPRTRVNKRLFEVLQ